MHWRLTQADYERQKGDVNKRAMRTLVSSGETPGLLAYADGRPVAWCAVAPRAAYPRLTRSRILKPLDETPVWSVVCFFVDKAYRNKGVSVRLLEAACAYVRNQGGAVVEGYPVEPKKAVMPPAFAWTGLASAFVRAGFRECARRSETRPIMRYYL